MSAAPTRNAERTLLQTHPLVAGMDEVGRGALAGPVTVGVVVVDEHTGRMPAGIRDSKLLTPAVREKLCDPIQRWAYAWGVGHATPQEIDRYGITHALAIAGHRALAHAQCQVDVVLLDGVHDWLGAPGPFSHPVPTPKVRTEKKGDLRISAIAAASILAKTERDSLMLQAHQEYAHYGWDSNKGYAAPAHVSGLRTHGVTPLHRRSWRLPGVGDPLVTELF